MTWFHSLPMTMGWPVAKHHMVPRTGRSLVATQGHLHHSRLLCMSQQMCCVQLQRLVQRTISSGICTMMHSALFSLQISSRHQPSKHKKKLNSKAYSVSQWYAAIQQIVKTPMLLPIISKSLMAKVTETQGVLPSHNHHLKHSMRAWHYLCCTCITMQE